MLSSGTYPGPSGLSDCDWGVGVCFCFGLVNLGSVGSGAAVVVNNRNVGGWIYARFPLDEFARSLAITQHNQHHRKERDTLSGTFIIGISISLAVPPRHLNTILVRATPPILSDIRQALLPTFVPFPHLRRTQVKSFSAISRAWGSDVGRKGGVMGASGEWSVRAGRRRGR